MRIYFKELSKSYLEQKVFENLQGSINEGDKIGIVGINGVGKSTLVKIIANKENCDSGIVKREPSNIKIKYAMQDICIEESKLVSEILLTNNLGIKIKKLLNELNLEEKILEEKFENLSGGEKTKIKLISTLCGDFDFLFLDEPTNHLDMKATEWLEKHLRKLNKTIVIVAHDRYFLDNVVKKIWELTDKGLKIYEGNYTDYVNQKDIEVKTQTREYENQQDKIRSLEKIISDRTEWFHRAHDAAGQSDFLRAKAKKQMQVVKSKEKELEKVKENAVGKPKKDIAAAFNIINRNIINMKTAKYLIKVDNLRKSFGEKLILKNETFEVERGDKIALIGENGTGKSTILKMIMGLDNEYDGEIAVNPSIKIGYLSQEFEDMKRSNTILDEVLQIGTTKNDARMLLACLMFRGENVFKKIDDLSLGERSRIAFAKLILSGAQLLILDEPTNYMDIVSCEKIEEVMLEYQGTILVVSHDRYFVKKLANKIFELKENRIFKFDGDYDYYLSKANQKEENKENLKIKDRIRILEYEVTSINLKIDRILDLDEKQRLTDEFIKKSRELNELRNRG
ncbi:ribosomal protection-like ABC-F family protein [Clostridium hydrogenum]|uniref:ribosomal protection-like ABC-F family protein n=1 Tax=Clostridium hydrogenum TaxID=2855764 RepID=UPI001F179D31|nr:ABC-F type ribosomal protection protein [Clostridium hydrogenum]